jgi:hypothetical protein
MNERPQMLQTCIELEIADRMQTIGIYLAAARRATTQGELGELRARHLMSKAAGEHVRACEALKLLLRARFLENATRITSAPVSSSQDD